MWDVIAPDSFVRTSLESLVAWHAYTSAVFILRSIHDGDLMTRRLCATTRSLIIRGNRASPGAEPSSRPSCPVPLLDRLGGPREATRDCNQHGLEAQDGDGGQLRPRRA